MKRVLFCFSVFLLCLLVSSGRGGEVLPPAVALSADIHEMTPMEVERYLVEHTDTVIIDVRTEEEYHTRGHLLNAVHHDLFHGEKTLAALAQMDKAKPYLVYCAIGGRAKLIASEMHKLGFRNILLLKGGFDAWTASGQAVAK